MSYTPPSGAAIVLDFEGGYPANPPGSAIDLEFAPQTGLQALAASAGASGGFGTPAAKNHQQFAALATFGPEVFGQGDVHRPQQFAQPASIGVGPGVGSGLAFVYTQYVQVPTYDLKSQYFPLPQRVKIAGVYSAPPGDALVLDFDPLATIPPGSAIDLEFGAVGYNYILGAGAGITVTFGAALVYKPIVVAIGAGDQSHIGALVASGPPPPAEVPGFDSSVFGTPNPVWNYDSFASPTGIAPGHTAGSSPPPPFPNPVVTNWRQYVAPGGFVGQVFGTAFIPTYNVLVPTIGGESFGAIKVDPRFVYPISIPSGLVFGDQTVQPNPFPAGWDSSIFGEPTVADNKQHVYPDGFVDDQVGQPAQGNIPQHVFSPSLVESGIFGDTRTYNARQYVQPGSVDDGFVSPFTGVINRNAYVQPAGIAPPPINGSYNAATEFTKYLNPDPYSWSPNDDISVWPQNFIPYGQEILEVVHSGGYTAVLARYQRAMGLDPIVYLQIYDADNQLYLTKFVTNVSNPSYSQFGYRVQAVGSTFAVADNLNVYLLNMEPDVPSPSAPDGLMIGQARSLQSNGTALVGAFTDGLGLQRFAVGAGPDWYIAAGSSAYHYTGVAVDSSYVYTCLWADATGDRTLQKHDLTDGSVVTSRVLSPAEDMKVQCVANGYVFATVGTDQLVILHASDLSEVKRYTQAGFGGTWQIRSGLVATGGYQYNTVGALPIVTVYAIDPQTLEICRTPEYFAERTSVHNLTPNVTPTPVDQLSFGDAGVGYYIRYVNPTGIAPGTFGTGAVANLALGISATGIAPTAEPHIDFVAPSVRTVAADSTDELTLYGKPDVGFYVRYLAGVGGDDQTLFGTTNVGPLDRVFAIPTIGQGDSGSPTVWFKVRTVVPDGYAPSFGYQFGGTKVQYALQAITLSGFGPETIIFGVTSAARNERIISLTGIAGAYGLPDVELWRRYVGQKDVGSSDVYGTPTVFNSQQFVTQFFDPISATLVGAVGKPLSVENRNKTITAYGVDTSKVSHGLDVENAARVITPAGLDVTLWGTAFSAYAIRTVVPQGWSEFFSLYNTAYNSSSVVAPSGIPRLYAGVPTVSTDDQYVDHNGALNNFTLWGDALVAYRIRYVDLSDHARGIPYGEPVPLPDVELHVRYVSTLGFAGGLGLPAIEHHQNLIGLHGADFSRYGEPFVWNVTPEVHVGPFESLEMGKPGTHLQWNYAPAQGFVSALWGKPLVDFRTKYVGPGGWNSLKMSALNAVLFDAPQIPAQQIVTLQAQPASVQPDGSVTPGLGFETDAFGTPGLNYRGMIAYGWEEFSAGKPKVYMNSVQVISIQLDEAQQVGTPSLNVPQYVICDRDPIRGDPPSPYRLNPFAIDLWIFRKERVPDTLEKYQVDFEILRSSERPVWGVPSVGLRDQWAYQFHLPDQEIISAFGFPGVELKNRTIYGVGGNTLRMGYPVLPGGQTITPYWGRDTEDWVAGQDYDTAVYGDALVGPPVVYDPNIHFNPEGANQCHFGDTEVDLFNRTIYPDPFYTTIFTGDTSVHPPVHWYPRGDVLTVWGTAEADFRNRVVRPEGDDLALWGEESNGFQFAPMRVRINPLYVRPVGIPVPDQKNPEPLHC